MATFRLFNNSEEIDQGISGAYEFLRSDQGHTGNFNLQGEGFVSYLNAEGIGVNGVLDITGNQQVHGDITGNFFTQLNDLSVTGECDIANITSSLTVNDINITGTADVAQFINGINVSGDSNFYNNVNIYSNLSANSAYLTGDLSTSGDLYVSGDSYLTGDLQLGGFLTSDLNVTKNLNAFSSLNVTGDLYGHSDVYAIQDLNVSGDLYVKGEQITKGIGSITGDLFAPFSERGQLIVGTGTNSGVILSTGSSAQNGSFLRINTLEEAGLEWHYVDLDNIGLDYWEEYSFVWGTPPYQGTTTYFTPTSSTNAIWFGKPDVSKPVTINASRFALSSSAYEGSSATAMGNGSVDLQTTDYFAHTSIPATFSTVGGGYHNRVNTGSYYSFIAGGLANEVKENSPYSFIGCGFDSVSNQRACAVFGLNGRANRYAEFVRSNDQTQSSNTIAYSRIPSYTKELYLDGASETIDLNGDCIFDIKVLATGFSQEIKGFIDNGANLTLGSSSYIHGSSTNGGVDIQTTGGYLGLIATGHGMISADVYILERFSKPLNFDLVTGSY